MAVSVVNELKVDTNTDNTTETQHQWVEITSLSSFTTKWSLLSSLNESFGKVLKISINTDKNTAKVLFSSIETAQKCCKWYTSSPSLDGERITIDLCSDLNITQKNAKRYKEILTKKLNGINDASLIEKIKFCPENLEKLTPLHIARFHAKILRLLSSTDHNTPVFITTALSIIGIDSYIFSEHFNTVNAIQSDDIFYANLVSNIKAFERYGTPIKCLNMNFFAIYPNLSQHIIYIDAFNLSHHKLKWNDCCPDIAYAHNNSISYLSNLCNDMYKHNHMKCNNNKNNKTVPLKLIAVKVPKHFMVSEFQQKVNECHLIVFDFKMHQFMVLDYVHDRNELPSLEFKCKDKRHELGFFKTFVLQSNIDKVCKEPPTKKRKLNNLNVMNINKREITQKDIAVWVRNKLKAIGFKSFGTEYLRNFKDKLKRQIVSKQMIREMIGGIDLKSKFHEIKDMDSFVDSESMHWIAPNVIAPRYLIYATAQWTIFVDEFQNMWYHPTFNGFYQKIFFGTNLSHEETLKTVSIIDGYLVPTNYFDFDNRKYIKTGSGTMCDRNASPLQFWILDILSYRNTMYTVLRDRFHFFQNVVKSYNKECQYLHNGPISIHNLHFEEYKNINNLLKFVKKNDEHQHCNQPCIVYQNNEGDKYAIDGFVVIKNDGPCTVHHRNKYKDHCVLWRCDFNALFTQHFINKRKQTDNAVMFQNNT